MIAPPWPRPRWRGSIQGTDLRMPPISLPSGRKANRHPLRGGPARSRRSLSQDGHGVVTRRSSSGCLVQKAWSAFLDRSACSTDSSSRRRDGPPRKVWKEHSSGLSHRVDSHHVGDRVGRSLARDSRRVARRAVCRLRSRGLSAGLGWPGAPVTARYGGSGKRWCRASRRSGRRRGLPWLDPFVFV